MYVRNGIRMTRVMFGDGTHSESFHYVHQDETHIKTYKHLPTASASPFRPRCVPVCQILGSPTVTATSSMQLTSYFKA
jgi:hypothetical protein